MILTTEEILRKVRELEIKSKKITTHLFTGEYHSAFKGKGMSFREVREYYAGDDVRFIDWNVHLQDAKAREAQTVALLEVLGDHHDHVVEDRDSLLLGNFMGFGEGCTNVAQRDRVDLCGGGFRRCLYCFCCCFCHRQFPL